MARPLDDVAVEATSLSDEELYRRIGAAVSVIEEDPTAGIGTVKSVDRILESKRGQEADLVGIGQRIAKKINEQLRELVCGSGDDYKEEREEFQKALGKGVDELSKAVAALLVATGVGVPAAAVAWVAGLIAKVLIEAGGDLICDVWKVAEPA